MPHKRFADDTATERWRALIVAHAGLTSDEARLLCRSEYVATAEVKGEGFKAQTAADGSVEFLLYDEIGPDWMGLIGAVTLSEALAKAPDAKQITLRINSPGGSAFEGIAMYNILAKHPAEVRVEIEGIAASAATLPAMAGKQIVMGQGAMMMIHDAWGIILGNSQEALEYSRILAKLDGQIASIYSSRSGRSADEFRKLMDKDTYLTGDEAIALGLATSVGSKPKNALADRFLNHFRAKQADGVPTPPAAAQTLQESWKAAANKRRLALASAKS